ncbi:hypothetical protein SADUNF_Sadunf16G0274900 [Salix dunnii]|uniref:Uncharacterized protein n=1 Tax=Salix dunnii TaxID=1413687 RepID=A0A835JC24_9ROSI|nr:hypothetical protein SADUNF_Sadunf16G0274900 [Salix dunnii]
MGVFLVCFFLISILDASAALETINPGQSMRDGETLVSASGSFELGFFSPQGSSSRYLGLWLEKSPGTVLWVANRENSLSDDTGVLKVTTQGILILLNTTNHIVWSSHSNASRTIQNPVAQLLDSGNFVVREGNDYNPANFLWQSFDHPCDTLLPGMRIGVNFVTRTDRFLSSWKSPEDPARGEFTFGIDSHGYPQLLLKKGNTTVFRGGPWTGTKFTSNPRPIPNQISTNEFVLNSQQVYFEYRIQSTVSSKLTLSPLGLSQSFTWNDRAQDWVIVDNGQFDQCENYAFCGPNTRCEITKTPICVCLDGFTPKSSLDWNFSDWSGGCNRRTPLNCSDKDGFLKYTANKLPDTSSSRFDKSIDLKECEKLCLKNCSCTAYANLDIREGGSGCLIWFGDLIDMRRSTGDGQDVYVRLAASELGATAKKRNLSKKLKAGIIASAAVLGLGMLMAGMMLFRWRRNLRKNDRLEEVRKEDMELPIVDLSTIAHATDNFSSSNKLGEGGFGPVYKPKQPGFFMGQNPLEQDSSSNHMEAYFSNEISLTMPEAR